ncbi:hypothetical protein Dda_2015 [Drechslerella dactyloides]|uniref:Uncharacterized protein n=1 Tax=Drechslerella dactyloides TaxID=74499 RepID=A0AAD6J3M0_DREDA|nr:hypothetical protein Dda_2015 [Drechslerella dactyloides]
MAKRKAPAPQHGTARVLRYNSTCTAVELGENGQRTQERATERIGMRMSRAQHSRPVEPMLMQCGQGVVLDGKALPS